MQNLKVLVDMNVLLLPVFAQVNTNTPDSVFQVFAYLKELLLFFHQNYVLPALVYISGLLQRAWTSLQDSCKSVPWVIFIILLWHLFGIIFTCSKLTKQYTINSPRLTAASLYLMIFFIFLAVARCPYLVCKDTHCPSPTQHGSCSNTQPRPSRPGLRSCWHERDDVTDSHKFSHTHGSCIHTNTHWPNMWLPFGASAHF